MHISNTIRATRLVLALLAILALVSSKPTTAQTPTVTDLFTFTDSNGLSPSSSLLLASDGNLYGTASAGGENGDGTIFKITSSGLLTTLYVFDGFDGAAPFGNLIQARDGNLYGTTSSGGANNTGTIFKITTGGALTTLYSFSAFDTSGNNADGANPFAGLIQASDGNFYGTTFHGGAGGSGTIYRMTPSSAFTSLHSFLPYVWTQHGVYPSYWYTASQTDGANPYAGLVQASDGNLYGTTEAGDVSNVRGHPGSPAGSGTVFKLTRAGAFTKLYSFGNGSQGANPTADLIQASDGSLYGTTSSAGANNHGTIFKITTGGALTTLYSFSAFDPNGHNTDGANPFAGLIQASDGNLYGTASQGGANNFGTVFRITTSGTLKTLHSFNTSDGASPFAGLIQDTDGKLYGTTTYGGASGNGAVFKITTTGALTLLYSFSVDHGLFPWASPIQASDGDFYSTTIQGGKYGYGTVFRMTRSGEITTLHSFKGSDGSGPSGNLIQASDGSLYGTAISGGENGWGTIFKITTGGTFTSLYSFNGDDGDYHADLIQAADGNFYGTTSGNPAASSNGTVFKMTTGGVLMTLYRFSPLTGSSNSDGAYPGALIQASDGNLYGTTGIGGIDGYGTVFKVTTGGKFTTLYSFTGAGDGKYPASLMQAADGNFYGTTSRGGANNGTVFKITPSGTFTTLHAFNLSDGTDAYAALIQASDGILYGTASYGGTNGDGTIFAITTSGVFTVLYSFNVDNPYGNPYAGLLQASDGALYGTTNYGFGLQFLPPNGGVVYRLDGVYPVPVLTALSPDSANAAGTAFTLNVQGSGFRTFSKVDWNGVPLQTTYVSPTALSAVVLASLIAAPGKAEVSVVTGAGGGASKSKTFTLLFTTLTLKAASFTRDTGKNTLTAVVSLERVMNF